MTSNSGKACCEPGDQLPGHVPVLLLEVVAALRPGAGQVFLDATFGAGGHARAILDKGARVIALDRDPNAVRTGQSLVEKFAGRLALHRASFSSLADFCPKSGVDGVMLDIGVSSMQLDEADRGFSFARNGPLDMRMSASGVSAADIVNRARTGDLIRIFSLLGEERRAGRIARGIKERRIERPFATTRDLAGLIERVCPRREKDRIHPATRVFQALRIFVNDELGELARALIAAERVLKPEGRLAVVTFHSLEDRIVKRFFRDRSGKAPNSRHMPMVSERPVIFMPVGKGPVSASDDEVAINPRARSAKLRAGIRTAAAPQKADMSIFGLPDLIRLESIGA